MKSHRECNVVGRFLVALIAVVLFARAAGAQAEQAQAAVDELGIEATVEKITDIGRIMEFGVMMTPALVVDGEVKVVGKVPATEEIKQYLA